jgi:ketosteroid isomerase-like protein
MRTTFFVTMLIWGVLHVNAADLPPHLRHDIDAGNREWVDGLKRGDAALVVRAYAEDAVNCSAAGDCVRRPAAVAAQYEKVIAEFGRATGGFVRSETLHVDHDLAYETGYAEAHFADGRARKGRFSTVWKRQPDGHWKIFRNLSLPPFH